MRHSFSRCCIEMFHCEAEAFLLNRQCLHYPVYLRLRLRNRRQRGPFSEAMSTTTEKADTTVLLG
jgi:hypothetical protein